MSRTICKLTDTEANIDYYFEWSSIVDAPVTYGQPLEYFKKYYQKEYGNSGMKEIDERLKRVEEFGTSSYFNKSFDDLIIVNRAGEHETQLTKQQILEKYCINSPINPNRK